MVRVPPASAAAVLAVLHAGAGGRLGARSSAAEPATSPPGRQRSPDALPVTHTGNNYLQHPFHVADEALTHYPLLIGNNYLQHYLWV